MEKLKQLVKVVKSISKDLLVITKYKLSMLLSRIKQTSKLIVSSILGRLELDIRRHPYIAAALAIALTTNVVIPIRQSAYKGTKLPKISRNVMDSIPIETRLDPLVHLHDDQGRFFCTGFVVDKHYIATAAHCVNDQVGRTITIKGVMDENIGVAGRVAGFNDRMDYALITGDFSKFNQLVVDSTGINTDPKTLVACGYPMGQKKPVCSSFAVVGMNYFQMKGVGGALFPGMSGGPVIDPRTGMVVGINSAVAEDFLLISPTTGIFGAFGVE